jgi:hypothetical protein
MIRVVRHGSFDVLFLQYGTTSDLPSSKRNFGGEPSPSLRDSRPTSSGIGIDIQGRLVLCKVAYCTKDASRKQEVIVHRRKFDSTDSGHSHLVCSSATELIGESDGEFEELEKM